MRVRTYCPVGVLALALCVGAGASLSAALPADVAALVEGNNQFAFDMYHKLRLADAVAADDGNLIFSPYSISTAVGMVYAGARGQTAREISDVFYFGPSQDRLHSAFGSLIGDLNGPHRTGYQLSVANRLWSQNAFPIHQPFLDTTSDHYGAQVGQLDFIRDTENSRQTINHWVEDQTNQRIKDLIPQGGVTRDTRLVLTNAIYFNGDWKRSFNKDMTGDRPFAVSATEQIRASTMFQHGRFRYADGGDFQMLELPYKDDQLSMLIVLPKAGGRASGVGTGGGASLIPGSETTITLPPLQIQPFVSGTSPGIEAIPPEAFSPGPIGINALTALEAGLTPHVLQSAIDDLRIVDVNVWLPKFKLTTGVTLKDSLSEMGMPTAFNDGADFLGISDIALKISQVRHKAFIELDEEGTEAAAATSIEMIMATSLETFAPPITFNADHPFQFLIRDNITGSTLFMGRVARPEGEIVPIPEPANFPLAILACAMLGLIWFGRRMR